MNRVVVTGMGALTPLGMGVDTFWNAMLEGRCAIDRITKIKENDIGISVAAEIKDPVYDGVLTNNEIRRLSDFTKYALLASDEALRDSGLIAEGNPEINVEGVDNTRIAVMVGSGIGGFDANEREFKNLFEKGPRRVSTLYIPTTIINAVAANISIKHHTNGKCSSEVTACSTASDNIGHAFRLIKHGYEDIVICGGSEASINRISVAGFANMRALSTSEDKNRASIPFDKDREGFVMGEGAAILVLESLESAKKRGAEIYAEIVGYGTTSDAYHITSPDPEGKMAALAIKRAIEEAGINKEDIGYINAHGTSTKYNDMFETGIIKNVFEDYAYNIPISSTKSATGHMLGAAGAIEAIACIKTINDGYAHHNINLVNVGDELDLDYIKDEKRRVDAKYTLSNSFGFGGHNAALIIGKYEEI